MEKPHDRLRKARASAGFASPKAASDRFGWSEHTYKSHENGNRGIKPPVAKIYAAAFKVSQSWLLTGEGALPRVDEEHSVTTIPVFGEAAAGVWMESFDIPIDDITTIPVIPDPRYPVNAQYARKVVGNSVSNRVRNGEYCIFVRYENYPGGPELGKLVDVERHRSGMREHTVKVFMGDHLATDSRELARQQELRLTNGDSDTTVSIVGIAIGAFRTL